MSVAIWLLTIALLSLSPQFRFTRDRCNYDGERFVQLYRAYRARKAGK